MKLRLLLAFLIVLVFILAGKLYSVERQAYAVWDNHTCPIQLLKDAKAVAPLVDGHPDYKNVRVTGVVLDNKCYSYELK